MSAISYLNFDLLITRAGDAYRAYVINAPGGDATATFTLPFLPQEVGRLFLGSGTRRHSGLIQNEAFKPSSLRHLGQKLFDAVFQDEMHNVLVASQTEANVSSCDLRIRLRFSDDAADLAILPWEILFDAEQQHFLALSESRSILRYLSLPRPRPALMVKPPLSILVVLASPSDQLALNVEQEWQAIETALTTLRQDDKVTLERLETSTLDALRLRLLGEPVHVLHFVGHGFYDAEQGQGQLLFEDTQRKSHLVPAKSLAMLLHNHSSLRLIYLNACEGAIADQDNVFAGIAQTLVQQGVPAAVAMQDEITDTAAIEIARTFYAALATGRPVDAALTQARVALAANENNEWIIPVLFSRSPDNHLFDVVSVLPTPTCPYPGMRPFTETQAELFYGRDKESEEAINRLAQHPFLTVVGPSGSGKSSLVYAGVLPALKKSPRFGNGEWTIYTMRPSDNRTSTGKAAVLQTLAKLFDCPADQLTAQTFETKSLLFVDQFEEVFTLAEAKEAEQFLATLHDLIKTTNLYILLTVRADFYPDLMATGNLWQAIKANRLELLPLGDDELWEAIVQPAAKVGVTIDDALAVALIADATGERGILPLMQETLVLLWEKVEKRALKLDAYRQMADDHRSGLHVAIDRWADNVYNNQLSSDAQPVARRIFLRLIQFGHGRADTRRQQTVEELRSSSDDPARFAECLGILTQSRLLTTSGEVGDNARRVDIAHEALITSWPTLQGWVRERREAEQVRRRLEEKVTEWERLGQGSGGLLDAVELLEAERWLGSADALELGISAALPVWVRTSRRVQEEELARKQRAARFRLGALGAIAILIIVALTLGIWSAQSQTESQRQLAQQREIAAATADANALMQKKLRIEAEQLAASEAAARASAELERDRADQQARVALARQLAAQAAELTGQDDGSLSLLLAREAVSATYAHDGTVLYEADTALRHAIDSTLWHATLSGHTDTIDSVSFKADGSSVLAGGRDGSIMVWDTATGKLQHTWGPSDNPIFYTALSPSGRWIVTGHKDGVVRIWDANSGKIINTLVGHEKPVRSVIFSPDNRMIVTTSEDGTARVWDIQSGKVITVFRGHHSETWNVVTSADFSPDSQTIVTGGYDGTVQIWNARSGTPIASWSAHGLEVRHVSFSPDGLLIATAGCDNRIIEVDCTTGSARVWDVKTGALRLTLAGHAAGVNSAMFSPDGKLIVTAGADGKALLWNVEDGQLKGALVGHSDQVTHAVFSHDGNWIATSSRDKTVRLWHTQGGHVVATLDANPRWADHLTFNPTGSYFVTTGVNGGAKIWTTKGWALAHTLGGYGAYGVSFSPDGQYIVTAAADGTPQIWDAHTGKERVALVGHTGIVFSARFSPDGRKIVTAGEDGTVRIWDAQTGHMLNALLGHSAEVRSARFDPAGKWIVSASFDGTARVWNAGSGELRAILSGHDGWVWDAVFSPDGQHIVTGGRDQSAQVWDAATGKLLFGLVGHRGEVRELAFSPNGQWIVTTDGFPCQSRCATRVWKANNGKLYTVLWGHTDSIESIEFSSDGRWLITTSTDHTARVWEIPDGKLRAVLPHPDFVTDAIFSPDASWIVTASSDGKARVWPLDPQILMEIAHQRIQRSPPQLTCEERKTYLHEEVSCP